MIVERHGSARETVYLQERHISQAFQEALFERVPAAERIGRLPELLGAATKLSDPQRSRRPAERAPIAFDEGRQAGVC